MWKIGGAVVLVAGVVLVASGNWPAGLASGLLVGLALLTLRASIVAVPARQSAVIFNRLKAFAGLRRPGLGWLLPGWEYVAFYLDMGPRPAQITLGDMHTRDQVPVSMSVSLIYQLDPWAIRREARAELVDVLEPSALPMLQRQAEYLLRPLVGGYSVAELLRPEVRAALEDALGDGLARQVSRLGVILVGPVLLGPIVLPQAVQAELNQAHQAHIHARARAATLDALREALGAQPERAWEKVFELEALEVMARHGVPLAWPYTPGWGGAPFGGGGNGKS